MSEQQSGQKSESGLDRRELLAYSAAFGSAFLAAQGLLKAEDSQPKPQPKPQGKTYPFKKSINLWAFPYPDQMTLKETLQLAKDAGFDGVELNYNLEGDLSPEASEADLKNIRKMADGLGIEISGLCSFLFWPYSLTSGDPDRRKKGRELARKMIEAAGTLGTKNLLVVPGAVYIPWAPEPEPVPNDVCHRRATEAIREVLPLAEKAGVSINIENIFANGFLLSPREMNDFVDGFKHDSVGVHFDTGNIMQFQFPEHWIAQCGRRIRNVHLKEYSKRAGTAFTLDSFHPLLDGTTNWPAVMEAFDKIGYKGYLTFEIFSYNTDYPEPLIYHCSNAMDYMLGRKS